MSEIGIAPPAGTAPPTGTDLVPGWLQRLAAVGWRLVAAILLGLVLLAIAVKLGTVTASILIAAIVAATFAPYVLALRRRGWSRIKAAAAASLGLPSSSSRRCSSSRSPFCRISRRSSTPSRQVSRQFRRDSPRFRSHRRSASSSPAPHRASRRGSRHPPPRSPVTSASWRRRDPRHVPDLLLHDGRRQGVALGAEPGQHLASRGDHDQRTRRP